MWLMMKYIVCLVLSVALGECIFIVGHKPIIPNRDYTLAVVNIHNSSENLLMRLEGIDFHGRPLLNLTKTTNVQPYTNNMITFKIPSNITDGNYSVTIVRNEKYQKYPLGEYRSRLAGLLQLSKPVITSGDTLKFRLIVLDIDLMPPLLNETTVSLFVQDPNGNEIRQWSNVSFINGIYENQITITTIPVLGTYNIAAVANGNILVSKTFEVREYELYLIDLNIYPTVVSYVQLHAFNLTVDVKNNLGNPLSGSLIMSFYFGSSLIARTKKLYVNGMSQFSLRFPKNLAKEFSTGVYLSLDVSFTEKYTNRKSVKKQTIEVCPSQYKVASDTLFYRPGSPFVATLKVAYLDNEPARNVTLRVVVKASNLANLYEQNYTSDKAGDITFSMPTNGSTELELMEVFEDRTTILMENIYEAENMIFLNTKLLTRVKFNRMLRLMVTCSHGMDALLYFIISKGNIVDVGFFRPNQMTRYTFQVLVSKKLIPRSKIFLTAFANGKFNGNVKDITVYGFGNTLEIKIEENIAEDSVDPGDEIELGIRGRPGAFVSLFAYDQRLMQHSKNHDIFLDDIWAMFEQFLPDDDNDFEIIAELGLSTGIFNLTDISGVRDYNARGIYPDDPRFGMPTPYRTDFWESWLWQNLTIPSSGRIGLVKTVPHSATSWHITGFSIDPEYGLGIVKKPISFSTKKLFFILDHLPHSIKRGEALALHFTRFSKLDEEFVATVEMFTAMNQIEFVDLRTKDATATKRVAVPPNSGLPVSFLVKVMKLGEVEIRLNASIMQGVISDCFKKIIRVLPEEMAITRSRLIPFRHDTPSNELYYTGVLIPWKSEEGSGQVYFTVYPDQQTPRNVSNNYNVSLLYDDTEIMMHVNSTSTKISKTDVVLNVKHFKQFIVVINGRSFNLQITKLETATKWLRQLRVCCSFIAWTGCAYSNDTLVEVSIPIGFVMDSHNVLEETMINLINRTEALHSGTTLMVYFNKMGNETNCFSVFAYRRYILPLKRPSYIKVQDAYHPELNALEMFDFY